MNFEVFQNTLIGYRFIIVSLKTKVGVARIDFLSNSEKLDHVLNSICYILLIICGKILLHVKVNEIDALQSRGNSRYALIRYIDGEF